MRVEKKLDFGPVQGLRVGFAPLGQPLMTVICYQLDNILIDTGPGNARKSVINLLDKNRVEKIYLTHYHEDHAGNAAFFKYNLKWEVWGSELTAFTLKQKVKLKPYEMYMWGGLTPVSIKTVGQRFITNKYSFRVIPTPGHSSDHVIYLEENEGWLFSGDMYLGARIKYFRKDEDLLQTIASLKVIGDLNFEKLFCGHNPQLQQPVKSIKRKIDFLENVLGEVRHFYEQGIPEKIIVHRLINKKESWIAKLVTLGDVSYKNLLLSALKGVRNLDN